MYEIDPSAGRRWLQQLRAAAPDEARNVVDIRVALREAEDGTTELWAIVVLQDAVTQTSREQRRQLLASLADRTRDLMVADPDAPIQGLPLVSFRPESEDRMRRSA